MARQLACTLVAALLAVASPAGARDPVAAEALFRLGREALQRQDYRTACDKFAESQRLDPAPGTLINLGECKAKLGLLASAWQHYREASDLLVGDDRRPLAERAAAALEPRLSRLNIRLDPSAPDATSVRRDDLELARGSLDLALPVDPGEHTVVVKAPGHEAKEYRVTLSEAQVETLVVEPGSELRLAGSSSDHGVRTAGFVVGALGLASLGAGIVTGVMTLDRKSKVEDNCVDGLCNQDGVDAAEQGRALSTASTVTFVVGLAGLATGVLLIALDGSDEPSASEPEPALALGPTFWCSGAGWRLKGSF
jgi:hypothetical protein